MNHFILRDDDRDGARDLMLGDQFLHRVANAG